MRTSSLRRTLGLTLVELALTAGIVTLVGGAAFAAVRTVSVVGAKTGSVNLTHQQARELVHKAVHQIHSSVSIPSLVNTSLQPVSGVGPAPGVSYQLASGGPYRIWSSAAKGTSVVRIAVTAGASAPAPGMRLILPAFGVEEDITAVVSQGGTPATFSITLAKPLTRAITCNSGAPNYAAYYTTRAALLVVNGELRHYPDLSKGGYSVVAPSVTTDTPFSIPDGDNRFVQADFGMRDKQVSNLNYKQMETKLQLIVPYRCRLTARQ